MIANIILGTFYYLLYLWELTPEQFNVVYEQRTLACQDCPLRSGRFCSRRKSETIVSSPELLENNPTGIVNGCGCFLPFKKSSNSQCPLDRWLSHGN